MAHKLGSYKDGNVSVPFCELCGAEGFKLFENCPQDKNIDKPVDKEKKRD